MNMWHMRTTVLYPVAVLFGAIKIFLIESLKALGGAW